MFFYLVHHLKITAEGSPPLHSKVEVQSQILGTTLRNLDGSNTFYDCADMHKYASITRQVSLNICSLMYTPSVDNKYIKPQIYKKILSR